MKFIVYADIHHDEYAAKCLTLQDTLEVERQVFNRASEIQADFILFGGDRFLKREPKDEVKVLADQVVLDGLARQKQGFGYFHLVGNHDRVDNTLKWHTAQALSTLLKRDTVLPGIMDEPNTYSSPGLPVRVHALPAGYSFDMSKYTVDPAYLNILLFHDIVMGSASDSEGKHIFEDGISLEDVDRPEFDLIYAGDIHVPQKFNLKNSKGGYVGAVLQRTRADANKPRGWLEIEADFVDGKWKTTTQFQPTRNFFTRYAFEVKSNTTYGDIIRQIDDQWVSDQAVEVKLTGAKYDVDKIADDPKWKNYTDVLMARRLDILRDYQSEHRDEVISLEDSQTPVEDLTRYIDSDFGEIGGLSKDRLLDIVGRYSHGN